MTNYLCKIIYKTQRLATIHPLQTDRQTDRRQSCHKRLQHSCSASI